PLRRSRPRLIPAEYRPGGLARPQKRYIRSIAYDIKLAAKRRQLRRLPDPNSRVAALVYGPWRALSAAEPRCNAPFSPAYSAKSRFSRGAAKSRKARTLIGRNRLAV